MEKGMNELFGQPNSKHTKVTNSLVIIMTKQAKK